MLRGEVGDIRHAVGHRAADGVEALEGGALGDVRLDVVDDAVELIERFRGLRIQVDIAGKIKLSHLVATLNHNRTTMSLTHQTKHFGMTFIEDLVRSRVSYAKMLLSTTNMNINDISASSGYHSYVHFARQFKEQTGFTPSEYRKKAQNAT